MDYFDELLAINKKYFPMGNNIRITNLTEVYLKLNEFYSKEFNLDEFVKLCITLFNMQIFFDGNARTILDYLTMVIDRYGYSMDVVKATDGLLRLKGLFPAMYDMNEKLTESEINHIKMFITEKQNKRSR